MAYGLMSIDPILVMTRELARSSTAEAVSECQT